MFGAPLSKTGFLLRDFYLSYHNGDLSRFYLGFWACSLAMALLGRCWIDRVFRVPVKFRVLFLVYVFKFQVSQLRDFKPNSEA